MNGFPLFVCLSMWVLNPLPFELPRCMWHTAYCVMIVRFNIVLLFTLRWSFYKIPSLKTAIDDGMEKNRTGSQTGVERVTLSLIGFFSCHLCSGRRKNAVISYGIL